MKAYSSPQGEILVNFSDAHDLDVGSTALTTLCQQALQTLMSFPKRTALSPDVEAAVVALVETGACLHPEFFLCGPGLDMNNAIPERFVLLSPLGFSILETLSEYGLFAAVDRRSKGGRWGNSLRWKMCRLLAAVGMMIDGADQIDQVPPELWHDIIGFFRDPSDLRWRSGFLKSDEISTTCFREFTRALAGYLKDDILLQRAKQTRLSHNKSTTWKAFRKRPTPLQAEILSFYDAYASTSRSNPKVDRQIVMDLDKLVLQEGYLSLREAMRQPFTPNAFTEMYTKRLASRGSYLLNAVSQAKRFSDFILEEMHGHEAGAQYYPIVTEKELTHAANLFGERTRKHAQSVARAIPERFHFLAIQILKEGATGWPGRAFQKEMMIDGCLQTIYCPVLPTLLLSAFLAPLRIAQFRRLDSGEGDLKRFNGEKLAWEANTSPNAGYWARKGIVKSDETRGYAYEFIVSA